MASAGFSGQPLLRASLNTGAKKKRPVGRLVSIILMLPQDLYRPKALLVEVVSVDAYHVPLVDRLPSLDVDERLVLVGVVGNAISPWAE